MPLLKNDAQLIKKKKYNHLSLLKKKNNIQQKKFY